MAIGLPGIEPRGRKVRTVRCIRIDLRLQTERVVLAMNAAIFAGHGSIEEIARIELDAGLVGPEVENAAGSQIFHARGKTWRAGGAAGQTVIVIVALPDLDLLIRITYPVADAMRRGALCTGSIDFLRVDWFAIAQLPVGDARARFGLVPKAENALAAGSVGPWEPGGISPYQARTGAASAEAQGRLYDAYGAEVAPDTEPFPRE